MLKSLVSLLFVAGAAHADQFIVKYTDASGLQWSQDIGVYDNNGEHKHQQRIVEYSRATMACTSMGGILPSKDEYLQLMTELKLDTKEGILEARKIFDDLSSEPYWTRSTAVRPTDTKEQKELILSLKEVLAFDFQHRDLYLKDFDSNIDPFRSYAARHTETYKLPVRCVRPTKPTCKVQLKVCMNKGYAYTVLQERDCALRNLETIGWIGACEMGSTPRDYMMYPAHKNADGDVVCSKEGSRLAAEQLASVCQYSAL